MLTDHANSPKLHVDESVAPVAYTKLFSSIRCDSNHTGEALT